MKVLRLSCRKIANQFLLRTIKSDTEFTRVDIYNSMLNDIIPTLIKSEFKYQSIKNVKKYIERVWLYYSFNLIRVNEATGYSSF